MKTSISRLSRILKESIIYENKVTDDVRRMFLTECRRSLLEANEPPASAPAMKTFDHVSKEEWNAAWVELHKKYWPKADPNGPVPMNDMKKAANFQKEFYDRLSKIHVKNGGTLAPEHTAYAKHLEDTTKAANKSWMQDFADGMKKTLEDKWQMIVKYAKTAGIVALVLGVVFLAIYGIRQTIEMIRTIKKTKREARDGSQVIMTVPFKNEQQMQKFFDVVRKKMSKYIEIESIDGMNVTISCDQKYMLTHVGEIKNTISAIKGEQNGEQVASQQQQIAAESFTRTITFSQLKRLVSESWLDPDKRLNAGCRIRGSDGDFAVIDPYGRKIATAKTEAEAEAVADKWSSMHELDEAAGDNRELTQNEKKQLKSFVYGWMDDHVNTNDEDPDELIQSNEENSCIDSMLGSGWFEDHGINYDELDYDKLTEFVHTQMKVWTARNVRY